MVSCQVKHYKRNICFENVNGDEGQKELHFIFEDSEKAYDWVPRQLVYEEVVSSTLKCVRVVKDMYEGSVTAVR